VNAGGWNGTRSEPEVSEVLDAGVYTTSSQYLRKNHLNEVGEATNACAWFCLLPKVYTQPHLAFLLQVLLQVQVSPLRALDALFVYACTPIAMNDSYKGPMIMKDLALAARNEIMESLGMIPV